MNDSDERRNYKKHIIDLIRFHITISGYAIFVFRVLVFYLENFCEIDFML